jgi:pumilio RNA-binding family
MSVVAATTVASLGTDSRNLGNNSLYSLTSSLTDAHNLGRGGNQAPTCLQPPLSDPFYVQYLKATQYAA